MGSGGYAGLLARHNELFEGGILEVEGARVVKHTGDGCFAEFPTASSAVRFALVFQSRMGLEAWGEHRLETRVRIHVGEMVLMEMAGQADVVGLTADLAARIMGLAVGGQILMTAQAFNDARQFVNSTPRELEGTPPLKWMAHGRYVFKGNEEPLEVFEVGIERFSPLRATESTEKAKRSVPHEMEATLGWRPAAGLEVPGRPAWLLEKKLGEGGFGEVWLAEHRKLKQERVFKFCFDVDRLRSFKRELTLFRVLREALGDREDIAQLYEVKLDEAPFFLESEYTPGGSLADWVARNAESGGLNKQSLEQRISLLADVAEAVAAAHSVGVLHKDIKPSNILVEEQGDGTLRPKLADFGIGALADKGVLRARNITETGMTLIEGNDSSRTGTRMYAPPESLAGKPFTVQGDIYALGVLLYQMVRGDLSEPLAAGWERGIGDALLREDIGACVDGEPSRRLGAAAELAVRLRRLPERRAAAAARARADEGRRRKQRNLRIAAATLGVAVAVLGTGLVVVFRKNAELRVEEGKTRAALVEVKKEKAETEKQRDIAVAQEAEAKRQTAVAEAVAQFQTDMLATADPDKLLGDKVTVLQAMTAAVKELDGCKLKNQPLVEAAVRTTVGNTLHSLARYDDAEPNLRRALELRRIALPAGHAENATSLNNLAALLQAQNKLAEAEPFHREALEIYRTALPVGHPDIALSLSDLAGLLLVQNKLAEAEPLYRESLTIRRGAFPAGHPDIAGSLNNPAALLKVKNKLAEAEPLLRESLTIRRATLPAGHPDIATSLSNLAEVLRAQNKLAEAEPLYRESLEIRRTALPAGHPAIATSVNSLARLLLAQNKLAEAEPLFREALEIYRGALPAGHPNIALSLNTLAQLLQAQNKLAEAEPLYRESLEIRRTALPAGHPAIATSVNSLARLLLAQNKLAEAEPLFREALEIYRGALPAGHPNIALSLNTLAQLLQAQNKLAEAEPLYRESLEIRRTALPVGHPDIAGGLNNLASLMLAQNKPAEAEPLFREALEIRRKTLRAGHSQIVESAASLGSVVRMLGRYTEAESLTQEALGGREKLYGATDARTCRSAFYLAGILDELGKKEEGEAVRVKYRLGDPATRPGAATRP